MSRTRPRRSETTAPREGVHIGPFRLTLAPLQLWRGRKRIPLQLRPAAVLRYFVEHPQTVISNNALRQAVWGRTVVSATTVHVCVREVRKALGDGAGTPRYLETVGREGYRFIAPLSAPLPVVRQSAGVSHDQAQTTPPHSGGEDRRLESSLVGRDAELRQLHTLLSNALRGERQLVFVTGEAGIGKTTLADAFLGQCGAMGACWIGRGQCVEHSGEGEAYLPVLEAVGHLCQGPEGATFQAVLRRYAPTWLLHLPGVVDPAEREGLQRQGAGATQGQMLREMAEALEAASATRGVILVFEDLHVSDPSTIELLAYLAQRRGRARLLLVGSYRPVEVILSEHPLRGRVQELLTRGYGQPLALESWTESEVATYLCRRLATPTLPAPLARWLFERTDGNALFVVQMVEYLLARRRLTIAEGHWRLRGELTADVVPDTLQSLILAQFHSLPAAQQQVLEAASVAGVLFTAANVAAGVHTTPEAVEELCEHIVRHGQFLRESGLVTWPDGTVSGQFGFRHALYPEVLYQQLSAGRRMRLHLAMGRREEAGYGERAQERAAELARHFVQGRDVARAVRYLAQAGQNALQRAAYIEAVNHLSQGLTLLATQPDTRERTEQEMRLQLGVGIAQMFTKGFAVPEVEQAFTRAHALCQQVGETPELFPVVAGLWTFYFARGELRTARQVAEQLLHLADAAGDPALRGVAHTNLQITLYMHGNLGAAQAHGEQALAQFSASPFVPLEFSYGPDTAVRTRIHAAAILHAQGYLDKARQQTLTALALAKELRHVLTIAEALQMAAGILGGCREWAAMQAHAAELIAMAVTQGLPFWWALGTCNHGVALTQQGDLADGISQMRQGLAIYRAAGAAIGITRVLGWLAEACGQAGQIQEGFEVLDEAFGLVERHEEWMWEAELYRRKGELTLQQSRIQCPESGGQVEQTSSASSEPSSPPLRIGSDYAGGKLPRRVKKQKFPDPSPHPPTPGAREAEACFLRAIAVARQQQAKLWELRATISLCRLWQRQNKKDDAREKLAKIYCRFTEGFATADLQEAKGFLAELA